MIRKNMLPGWDDFRTFRWLSEIEFPEKLLDESNKLLKV